jgi:hypothetical protein
LPATSRAGWPSAAQSGQFAADRARAPRPVRLIALGQPSAPETRKRDRHQTSTFPAIRQLPL